MKIFYDLNGALYANITNKCPCACTFCIRKNDDTVGKNDSLWLEHEPAVEEIKAAFDEVDTSQYNEVVFCGFGEPMQRPDELLEIARYIKDKVGLKIRINTNGLVKLIDPDFNLEAMKGLVDSVSISLNASDAKKYLEITRSRFGIESYDSMLKFAAEASEIIPNVAFTVVDVIGDEEVALCQKRADSVGVALRVRKFISNNRDYN